LTLTSSFVAFVSMANVLSEDKKQQVIALGRLGWSLRRIQQATGVRRETAGSYLRAAGIALRSAGWPSVSKPAIDVTTDSEAARTVSNHVVSACEPYREMIERALSLGRNAMAIWQDLVDQNGFAGSYQTVKRFVRGLRRTRTPEARAIIVTAPGEEAQVDYGTGPMVRDPLSGKYRRTRMFVMTLDYSRKAVRLLAFRLLSLFLLHSRCGGQRDLKRRSLSPAPPNPWLSHAVCLTIPVTSATISSPASLRSDN
jgi:hypothetical protein